MASFEDYRQWLKQDLEQRYNNKEFAAVAGMSCMISNLDSAKLIATWAFGDYRMIAGKSCWWPPQTNVILEVYDRLIVEMSKHPNTPPPTKPPLSIVR